MNKTLYILRHGETDFNRHGIVQGSGVDTSLNDLGRSQAEAFFRAYHDVDFEVVITSALQRTHQTVQPFIQAGIPWEQHREINEISWGVQEGKTTTETSKLAYRQVVKHWNTGNFSASMEAGESAAELAERVNRFVAHVRDRPEQKILICAHGRTMRCLMCVLSETDLCNMDRFAHSNTGLWIVEQVQGRFHFKTENDTSHLNGKL